MNDHSHFEELAALLAGGHLSDEELQNLQSHAETCPLCKGAMGDFRELLRFGLPLAQSRVRSTLNMIMTRPNPGARERFIRRASLEGIEFSPEVNRPEASRRPYFIFAGAGVGALAAIVVTVLYFSHHLAVIPRPFNQRDSALARQQLGPLLQQNSALEATISRLEHTLAEQQRENTSLRAQVAVMTEATNNSRANKQLSAEATASGRSIEEAKAQQEKLLADTRAELARLKQALASDQASLVADQIRINELSERVKTAKTNASLALAGGDVRNVMGARQLHVVDVRDTGPDGKPGKAFGRIFMTEGKSLVFYAFDLNDQGKNGAKKTFQVWGQQQGKAGSLRSLGFLNVDSKTQQRWALKTTDVAAFKQIDSVFVTVEPQGGAKTPSGQRLLFAYLGQANHP
jgi:hypothetical protein